MPEGAEKGLPHPDRSAGQVVLVSVVLAVSADESGLLYVETLHTLALRHKTGRQARLSSGLAEIILEKAGRLPCCDVDGRITILEEVEGAHGCAYAPEGKDVC